MKREGKLERLSTWRIAGNSNPDLDIEIHRTTFEHEQDCRELTARKPINQS